MDFRGLVWKRVWKITFFGLKSGQDLKNRAAHPHQEFPGVPPGEIHLHTIRYRTSLLPFSLSISRFLGKRGKIESRSGELAWSLSLLFSHPFSPRNAWYCKQALHSKTQSLWPISITAIENHLWLRIVVKFFFACKECYFITTSAFFLPFYFNCCRYWRKFAIFEPYYSQMNKRIV